jgi:PPK2 family polyphosphate:nucleotide phosphotransferase
VDASGKDGTIKHVMSGVNPQGVQVTPFKEPAHLELAHDFLWRTQVALPARGHIGVFNRSHYEEVLIARVHPTLLAGQGIDPVRAEHPKFWAQRFEQITAWERHLTLTGTRVIKFFLHVSKEEQLKRFLARADIPEKHWKFAPSDLREHRRWDDYERAYEEALRATSTKEEPWYVIPGDHKWFMRTSVAAIIVKHLAHMDPSYPMPSEAQLDEMRTEVKQFERAEAARARDDSPHKHRDGAAASA